MGSAVSTWFKIDPGPVRPIAAFLLILSGTACVAIEIHSALALAWIAVVSIIAETLGLYTGYPFGPYEYTGQWWPSIPIGGQHTFPFLLPFAWILVVGGSYAVASSRLKGWGAILATGLLASVIDAPMERAMTDVFHYWVWRSPGPIFGVPVLNSIGWFVVASIAACGISRQSRENLHQELAPKVLALFCGFIVVSGSLAFFDRAWLALGVIVVLLTLNLRSD